MLAATVVFARKLDRLSERLGVSEGLHGILTALGADAPEISTAITALASRHSKLGVGVREEIEDLRTDETAPKASLGEVAALAPSLAVIVLGSIGMVRAATDLG